MKNTIKGRIATDITLTETDNNNIVANFRIAENKAYQRKGRKFKLASFYAVKAWNGVAKAIERTLQKGDLVEFETNVTPNSWVDKHGELKEELLLTVNSFRIVRRKGQMPQAV